MTFTTWIDLYKNRYSAMKREYLLASQEAEVNRMSEITAARLLQNFWKKVKARKIENQRNDAAVIIQKNYRRILAQRQFAVLVDDYNRNAAGILYNNSAIAIQRIWKGYKERNKYLDRKRYIESLEAKFAAVRELLSQKRMDYINEQAKRLASKKLEDLEALASRKHHLLSTKAVQGVCALKTKDSGLNDTLLRNSIGLESWKREHIGKYQSQFRRISLDPIDTSKLTEYQKQKPFLGPFLPRYELEKFKNIKFIEKSGYNLPALLRKKDDDDEKIRQIGPEFKVPKQIHYQYVSRLDSGPYQNPLPYIKKEPRNRPPIFLVNRVDQKFDSSEFRKLYVIDFDSTLFRSPLPNPELWSTKLAGAVISDCWWFSEPRTLLPPFVPENPGLEWWNEDMINQIQKALEEPTNLVILLTGRRRAAFGNRILDLTQKMNLGFHFVFCKETESIDSTEEFTSTIDFKFGVLSWLLQSFPKIRDIQLYDDREKHCKLFITDFKERKSNNQLNSFTVQHVTIDEMLMPSKLERELVMDLIKIHNDRIDAFIARTTSRVQIGSSVISPAPISPSRGANFTFSHKSLPRKAPSISGFRTPIVLIEHVSFLGIFLDEGSRKKILETFPLPKNWKLKCEHMTVSFGRADKVMMETLGGVGTVHKLVATHIGTIPDCVSALKIDPTGLVSENSTMHVTLYISPRGKSRKSNEITDWKPLENPMILSGVLGTKVVTGMTSDLQTPVVKLPVSIGDLVLKHHPSLKGKNIGIVVKHVNEWMGKQFVENEDSNRANIEFFIQSVDITKLIE